MSQKRPKYSSRKKKTPILPILLALGGLLLIAAAAFSLTRSKADPNFKPVVTGSPSLKADQEKVDLGDVPLGKTVQASFVLTNVGDKPLSFTEEPYIEVLEGC
jgi:hypothetical protein